MEKDKSLKLSILKGFSFLLSRDITLWVGAFSLTFLLLIQGCAPAISPKVKRAVSREVSFQKVIRNPDIFIGETVLWGGRILSTKNLREGTLIEVVQIPLDFLDRPIDDISSSKGRFLIQSPEFFDSEVYKRGKEITVAGIIEGKRVQEIGELEYSYPLIQPLEIKLWKPLSQKKFSEYPPFFYDPFLHGPFFYDPFFYTPFFPPYPRLHPPDWHPPHGNCPYWHPPSYDDNC